MALQRRAEDHLVEHLHPPVNGGRLRCGLADGHLHIVRGDLGHVLLSQRFDNIDFYLGGVVHKGGRAGVGAVHGEPLDGVFLHGGVKERTFKKCLREYEQIKKEQEKIFPELKARGEKILLDESKKGM